MASADIAPPDDSGKSDSQKSYIYAMQQELMEQVVLTLTAFGESAA